MYSNGNHPEGDNKVDFHGLYDSTYTVILHCIGTQGPAWASDAFNVPVGKGENLVVKAPEDILQDHSATCPNATHKLSYVVKRIVYDFPQLQR